MHIRRRSSSPRSECFSGVNQRVQLDVDGVEAGCVGLPSGVDVSARRVVAKPWTIREHKREALGRGSDDIAGVLPHGCAERRQRAEVDADFRTKIPAGHAASARSSTTLSPRLSKPVTIRKGADELSTSPVRVDRVSNRRPRRFNARQPPDRKSDLRAESATSRQKRAKPTRAAADRGESRLLLPTS